MEDSCVDGTGMEDLWVDNIGMEDVERCDVFWWARTSVFVGAQN
jgi:hypothetical protein